MLPEAIGFIEIVVCSRSEFLSISLLRTVFGRCAKGILRNGKEAIHAYLFDKEIWTKEEALQWVRDREKE